MNHQELVQRRNALLDFMETHLVHEVEPQIEEFNQLMKEPLNDGSTLLSYEQVYDYNVYRDKVVLMVEGYRQDEIEYHRYYTFKRDKNGTWQMDSTEEETYHEPIIDLDKMA